MIKLPVNGMIIDHSGTTGGLQLGASGGQLGYYSDFAITCTRTITGTSGGLQLGGAATGGLKLGTSKAVRYSSSIICTCLL